MIMYYIISRAPSQQQYYLIIFLTIIRIHKVVDFFLPIRCVLCACIYLRVYNANLCKCGYVPCVCVCVLMLSLKPQ